MPDLLNLCLRYLAWIVVLRILHILGVQFLGLPNTLGTVVILASVPAVDIGMQFVRRAGHVPEPRAWLLLGLALFATYLILQVGFVALFLPGGLAAMFSGQALVTWLTVMLMIALFLWLGGRQERRRLG